MKHKKPEQKLISFMDNPDDLDKISSDMDKGWSIVSLVRNHNYYVGIMEKTNYFGQDKNRRLYIPPRKKIKISN